MTVWTWLEFVAWLRTLRDPGVLGPLLGLFLVGLIVPVLLFGIVTGGNHLDASYEASGKELVSLCPGRHDRFDAYSSAAQDYLDDTDCTPPDIRVHHCQNAPLLNEFRIYLGTTFLVDDAQRSPGLSAEQWDNVGPEYAHEAADAPANVENHILGHIMGLGRTRHATAASSWMARVPGDEPTGISCGGDQ